MAKQQQKKANTRKPVSREKMLAYLYRHKLKKKYRPIRPHTFANSQGLSTRQLETQPSNHVQKPIINKNVKARLESNLQFLLENQNLNATRVRNPESFISLNVKKLKGGSGSTSTITKSNEGSTRSRSGSNRAKQRDPPTVVSIGASSQKSPSSSSRLSTKTVAFHNAGQNQKGQSMPSPPNLQAKSGHKKNRQPDAFTFSKVQTPTRSVPYAPDADSFDFHSAVSQHRAGQQFQSTTSFRQTDKRDSKKHSREIPESNRSSATNRSTRLSSRRFENDDSFGFNPMQTRNQTVVRTPSAFSNAPDPFFENQSHENFGAAQGRNWEVTSNFDSQSDFFDAEFQSHSRHTSLAIIECTKSSAHRSESGTVRKTRFIRSSISRVGESPFMEEIVIQKMKQKM